MARVLTAIVFIPILMAALWIGSPFWFVGMAGVAILLGLHEYHSLSRTGDLRPARSPRPPDVRLHCVVSRSGYRQLLAAVTTVELLLALWRAARMERITLKPCRSSRSG
jgi:CDP-diglyceride synthetase